MGDAVVVGPVRAVEVIAADTACLHVDRPFRAQPGQFAFLWIPGAQEKPYSVSGATHRRLAFTIRGVGPHSRALLALRPGDLVGLRGPFGRPFTVSPGALLVGGGIGAAPLRFLGQRLAAGGLPFRACLGARTADGLVHRADFEAWGARIATDDGSAGTPGPVTDLLEALLDEDPSARIQACGPEPMLKAVRRIAAAREVPCELSFERMMKCGLGICGQCAVEGPGFRLCVEGPVLEGPEADLALEPGDGTR
ncbi:MAG: dihydroorotate dehydrogenase [Deltaproteobacteria bacterium]|nr:dihydroorotate dehydrogenase [Deltaproteobacteria bacterium]